MDYDQFVGKAFNVVLDLTRSSAPSEDVFISVKEHFALSSPRTIVAVPNPPLKAMALFLSEERLEALKLFLTCDTLDWEMKEENGRSILVFK